MSETLNPFEIWMVQQNMSYVDTEGLEVVVSRLKAGGYDRVAAAVNEQCKGNKEKPSNGETLENLPWLP